MGFVLFRLGRKLKALQMSGVIKAVILHILHVDEYMLLQT